VSKIPRKKITLHVVNVRSKRVSLIERRDNFYFLPTVSREKEKEGEKGKKAAEKRASFDPLIL